MRPALGAFGPVRCPDLPRERAGALAAARAAVAGPAPVALVGHSMGAVIALRVAAERSDHVRAVVLGGCFFPPARNGRSLPASVAGYGRHRVAFLREARRGAVPAGSGAAGVRTGGAGPEAHCGRWSGSRCGRRASTRSPEPCARRCSSSTPPTTTTCPSTSRWRPGPGTPTGRCACSPAAATTRS